MYVSGREESLKRTFELLDLDHDGRLTASEVEAGLSNFAFTCPFSRCVYRTKQQVLVILLPYTATLLDYSKCTAMLGETFAPCLYKDIRTVLSVCRAATSITVGQYWLSMQPSESCTTL